MGRLFDGVRAPSTPGTFLRVFTHGRLRRLHAMHSEFLARLSACAPLLPDADRVAFVDMAPTHRRVYGHAKQGAEVCRRKGQRTLQPILPGVDTGTRPVVAAVRLWRGKAADARGASQFTGEALATAERAGATGIVVVRADSQFYNADVVAAFRRATARPDSVRMNPSIAAAISRIAHSAWTTIR